MRIIILLAGLGLLQFCVAAKGADDAVAIDDTTNSASATGTSGFLDIAWGSSVAEVKTAMAARQEIVFSRESTDGLEYGGGTFAGVPVDIWQLGFVDGKFCKAAVSFEYPVNYIKGVWAADKLEEALTEPLDQKYGKVKREHAPESITLSWSTGKDDTSPNLETITLFHSWNAHIMRLTYSNDRLEMGSSVMVDPSDL